MNISERKFLLAVERGDLARLKTLLSENQNNPNLDINCCDPLARNALVIAIDNENLAMVKVLIEAGIRIGDALLYAIDENFVEAVELLLDHERDTYKPGNLHSWEKDREFSTFSADMTPLILAAHRNNFEVLKILLDRQVSPMPDPHDPRCDCNSCSVARADDCLKYSQSRINAYRALASPCLIALSSPDPLLTAFEMSAKLESLAKMEPEYKEEYLSLRAQCQTFATKLLDHTRTSKELEILLNYSDDYLEDHDHEAGEDGLCCQAGLYEISRSSIGYSSFDFNQNTNDATRRHIPDVCSVGRLFPPINDLNLAKIKKKDSVISLDSVTDRHESYHSHMRLARLRFAIECKQKTFCAHPNIQELLASMWYENLPGFRQKNPIAQTLQVIFIGLMFPIYSMAYLIAPHSQLGRFIKKPFIKFICHSASYITFLVVLILASQRVEAFYNWDSIYSLFVSDNMQFQTLKSFNSENNFTSTTTTTTTPSTTIRMLMPLSAITTTATLAPRRARAAVADYDDNDLNGLAAANKQRRLGGSSARGLDGLSKIFEQLPASSKKRGTGPSPIELVILIWVLSLIWAEVKQLRALGINYYKADMWNILDSVASGFYIGTIILRFISYVQSDEQSAEVAREHWHAYDPILLSEGLFAAATIFSALKLVYIFSVNPYLGPLQISLGRMIIDILRFSWIYLLVLFSFACGMNQLLWYYADLERHQCLNITNYSLAQYYSHENHEHHPGGATLVLTPELQPIIIEEPAQVTTESHISKNMSDDTLMEEAFKASLEDDSSKPPVTMDDSCKTWRYFSNVFESSQTLFWATFGLVDLENFDLTGIQQYTRFWALLMFGCYCFINVIVVLNLLIAMMNHSYVKISTRSDIEWKFARTRLWMSYFDTGSTVPAPFNILPSIKSFICLVKFLYKFFYLTLGQLCNFTPIGNSNRRKSGDGILSEIPATQTRQNRPETHAKCMGKLDFGSPVGQTRTKPNDTFHMIELNNKSSSPSTSLKMDQETRKKRDRGRRNCSLTASYRNVMRALVRRYLVNEQRLLERKRELTEAKLNRWAKLNAFH